MGTKKKTDEGAAESAASRMVVERLAIDSLHEDAANVRTHDQRNLDAIKSSLARFGQQKPIVVDANNVVRAGNGTLAAARALGWQDIAVVRTALGGSEATAYAIADNRTAELADWDQDALGQQLAALQLEDEALAEAAGFTQSEFDALVSEIAGMSGDASPVDDVEEDETPEPPKEPVTKPGDLWVLGDHRLLCGDCRDPEDVARLCDGEKVNLAFTSPPYASQRKYDESSGFKPIRPDDYVEWFEAVQANVAAHLADDGSWFVNIKEHCEDGQRHLYVKDLTIAHVRKWGWRFVDELCWKHGGFPGKMLGRFKNGWEPVFHYCFGWPIKFRPASVGHYSDSVPVRSAGDPGREYAHGNIGVPSLTREGLALPSNVLEPGRDTTANHPGAFPVGLPAFFVKAYTDEGDRVFDPFMGSGTTLVASEKLSRRGLGTEISPAYCDVIVERWENLTGGKAKRGSA